MRECSACKQWFLDEHTFWEHVCHSKTPTPSPPSQPCSYSEPPPKPEQAASTEDSVVWINCNCGWKSNIVAEYAKHASKCPKAPKPNNIIPFPSPPESVCAEADRIINGERRNDYGPVEESFKRVAEVWSGLLRQKLKSDSNIESTDVAILMAAFKLCRESNASKRDNRVDCIGYVALLDQIVNNKNEHH